MSLKIALVVYSGGYFTKYAFIVTTNHLKMGKVEVWAGRNLELHQPQPDENLA
jgi:hypothetical protein